MVTIFSFDPLPTKQGKDHETLTNLYHWKNLGKFLYSQFQSHLHTSSNHDHYVIPEYGNKNITQYFDDIAFLKFLILPAPTISSISRFRIEQRAGSSRLFWREKINNMPI